MANEEWQGPNGVNLKEAKIKVLLAAEDIRKTKRQKKYSAYFRNLESQGEQSQGAQPSRNIPSEAFLGSAAH